MITALLKQNIAGFFGHLEHFAMIPYFFASINVFYKTWLVATISQETEPIRPEGIKI